MTDRQTLPSDASFWPALALREQDIARQWLERVCADYPPQTAAFLIAQADPFANPVGDRARRTARAFARVLTSSRPLPEAEEELTAALADLMRVRAIQALTPEEAVGVFFAMKESLRTCVAALGGQEAAPGTLWTLDARIDRVALAAFGQYSRCRETLFAIRAEEIRRRQAGQSRFLPEAEGEEGP
jgi:hypothetical protein